MTQKILCLSGRKQSGKSSLANFISGYEMRRNNVINWFDLSDEGRLQVPAKIHADTGEIVDGIGYMDIDRQDEEFTEFAKQNLWPYAKVYSFADRLKQILILVFGLKFEQLYGTDEQKNTPTDIKWKDIQWLLSDEKCVELSKVIINEAFRKEDSWDKFLTGRDMAQIFGSDVCRKIKNNCWVEACYADILADNYPFVIIADARFPNELDFMKEHGAKLIRLTRNPHKDNHISETALNTYTGHDLVIDNAEMTLKEKNQTMLQYLMQIGWTGSITQ
jgi:hypothetical protein